MCHCQWPAEYHIWRFAQQKSRQRGTARALQNIQGFGRRLRFAGASRRPGGRRTHCASGQCVGFPVQAPQQYPRLYLIKIACCCVAFLSFACSICNTGYLGSIPAMVLALAMVLVDSSWWCCGGFAAILAVELVKVWVLAKLLAESEVPSANPTV